MKGHVQSKPSSIKAKGVHKESNGALVSSSYHKHQQEIQRTTSRVMRITARRHK